ncbi:four-carbon acid sugar kinase family protein [Pantoea sp. ACRSH]|uniref:D-threonate kinase n=1 Tax=unclassified Pantoea TaxID=2630326 RepID=UPI001EF64ADB|nr:MULTISPECIES: four-carbon acid sugar kinase family protein [unclassified Pantoea]MCG7367740.1 four-carbon acid sugar kinase family protein [Pantoea sp. ACRSH]MCG7398172.1 four-carbon acid sugar kinase family protein [Pantoea sp. ACRSC]
MTQKSWKTPVLVIADDFTGANDAGSGLAKAGARVHVLFSSEAPLDVAAADVWVISTDSRAVSAAEAAARTEAVVRRHQDFIAQGWLFKKIDSTLRGNIGAEVRAALAASGKQRALIVPAVPRLGRVTRRGEVQVNGVPLTETEYASDPKTPVISARVLTQLGIAGREIDLAALRSDRFAALLAEQQGAVVIDAESESDIALILAAAAQLDETPLLVGAAGLSDALGAQLAVRATAPVLAVIGSMSASAQQQIARLAAQRDITLVDIDIRQLFERPRWPDGARWAEQVLAALRAGRHTVLRTCQHAGQRHEIEALCRQQQITRQQLGEAICQFLGELTLTLCRAHRPAALYLSGGDVAIAVAQALGASGFEIQGIVADCVPHGVLLNSEFTLPVMTKAGGFGDENTLVAAIGFIEEKSSE